MKRFSAAALMIGVSFCVLSATINTQAKEITLNNGDKISGTVVSETAEQIILNTQAMGQVTIQKSFLTAPVKETPKGPHWKRKVSVGYGQTGGNTETQQFNGKVSVNRKTEKDEWSAALNSYVATSNSEEEAKKFSSMLRYAFSFGESLKWYNFYKIEGDQNRFSNIDYRIVPSAGFGYWFSDADNFKAMAEGAVGYEYTNYIDATDSASEVILVPRAYLEKTVWQDLKLSQELVVYPSLDDGDYRFFSETAMTHALSKTVSWKMSFIDDYDSNPSGSAKKNDYRLISSLEYAF